MGKAAKKAAKKAQLPSDEKLPADAMDAAKDTGMPKFDAADDTVKVGAVHAVVDKSGATDDDRDTKLSRVHAVSEQPAEPEDDMATDDDMATVPVPDDDSTTSNQDRMAMQNVDKEFNEMEAADT